MTDQLEEYRKKNPRQKDLFHFVPDVKINEPVQSKPDNNTSWKIQKITESLNSLLQHKNRNYGDSALNPVKIFSKLESTDSLFQRADDKISRIQNSKELRVNDLIDLMGYCVLICASKDWLSFEEFKD